MRPFTHKHAAPRTHHRTYACTAPNPWPDPVAACELTRGCVAGVLSFTAADFAALAGAPIALRCAKFLRNTARHYSFLYDTLIRSRALPTFGKGTNVFAACSCTYPWRRVTCVLRCAVFTWMNFRFAVMNARLRARAPTRAQCVALLAGSMSVLILVSRVSFVATQTRDRVSCGTILFCSCICILHGWVTWFQ